jgi:hypothetical protein
MAETVLKRQFITDAAGNPVAVILPMEEFDLVKEILDQRLPTLNEDGTLDHESQSRRSVQEAEYFGMWADRKDMRGLSSREWLENLRKQHWTHL